VVLVLHLCFLCRFLYAQSSSFGDEKMRTRKRIDMSSPLRVKLRHLAQTTDNNQQYVEHVSYGWQFPSGRLLLNIEFR